LVQVDRELPGFTTSHPIFDVFSVPQRAEMLKDHLRKAGAAG
jgi:hypothetical protein